MFQLDDKFLEEVGLGDLPADQKGPFLQYVYEQLEYKVGVSLSDGMSDAQLQEFESIIDKRPEAIESWLLRVVPDFGADPLYGRIQQATALPPNDPALNAEYAATKWLEVNRPDYLNVVKGTLNQIKQEIIANRDSILGLDAPAAG